VTCALVLPALGQNEIVPRSFLSFDGVRWSGLTIGVDTDGSLKKAWKTTKGAVRPEALRLVSSNPDVRVDAILGGRGERAVLEAIRLEFVRAAPTVGAIAMEIGEAPARFWQTAPNEDWHAATFPGKGLIVLVLGQPGDDDAVAHAVILANPSRVADAFDGYTAEPNRIVPVFDPGKDWDRTTRFGDLRCRISPASTNRPPSLTDSAVRRLERDTLSSMRNAYARGAMQYENRSSGRYEISITSGKFNEKLEASFSGTAKYTAETPYGPIELTEYESKTIKDDHYRNVERLIESLMDDLERQVFSEVRRLGPPPTEARRLAAWAQMLDVVSGRR